MWCASALLLYEGSRDVCVFRWNPFRADKHLCGHFGGPGVVSTWAALMSLRGGSRCVSEAFRDIWGEHLEEGMLSTEEQTPRKSHLAARAKPRGRVSGMRCWFFTYGIRESCARAVRFPMWSREATAFLMIYLPALTWDSWCWIAFAAVYVYRTVKHTAAGTCRNNLSVPAWKALLHWKLFVQISAI